MSVEETSESKLMLCDNCSQTYEMHKTGLIECSGWRAHISWQGKAKDYEIPTPDEIARLTAENRDLRERVERYERMIGQAYLIEFTDWERVIEKYGSDSMVPPFDTGIVWIVQDEDGNKLFRHATALDAFEAIEKE